MLLAQVVERGDAMGALERAVDAIVLAPAGPPRQRTMQQLYRDERSSSLPMFELLERMYDSMLRNSRDWLRHASLTYTPNHAPPAGAWSGSCHRSCWMRH